MALAARAYVKEERRARRAGMRRPRSERHARRMRLQMSRSVQLALVVAIPLAFVILYVWLTAQLTAQTYRLHDDQALQTALTLRDNELRQQVARLESLPRLEAAAAKLHMHVPEGVALVAPARQAPTESATSIAASFAGLRKWLHI